MSASERLAELAQKAGGASLAGMKRQEALAKVAQNLERTYATLQRQASGRGAGGPMREPLSDFTNAMQQAETLVTGATMENDLENKLWDTQTAPQLDRGSVAVLIESLEGPARGTIALLQAALAEGKRQRVIVRMNPADAPVEYRESVAEYFERLSKDYQPGGGAAP